MRFLDWSTVREKNQTGGNNLTHFHLLRTSSVPYSIPNKNSTLSKISMLRELSLVEYNTLYVITEMGRATGVHKGQHLFYLENHKTHLDWFLMGKEILSSQKGEGRGFQAKEMNEGTWQGQGTWKKNCTKYKKGGLRKRPTPVKGPLFLKQSSPWITAFI